MDTPKNALADHRQAVGLVRGLEFLMEREEENNWIRGVRAVLGELRWTDAPDAPSAVASLREAGRVWRNMHGGMGSFSDFYLHRDSFDEQVAANRELEALTVPLSALFERYR